MKTCQSLKKTKHPTKGKKKVQDGKTQVLANEESSKEGEPLREQEQIMKLPPTPTQSHEKHNAFFEFLLKCFCQKSRVFGTGFARPRAFSKVWLDPPVDGCKRAYTTKAGKKKKTTLERA